MPEKKNSRARKKQCKPRESARINVGGSQPGQGYREQTKRYIMPMAMTIFQFSFWFKPPRPSIPHPCLTHLTVRLPSRIPCVYSPTRQLFKRVSLSFVATLCLFVVRSKPVRFDHLPLLCSTILFIFPPRLSFVSCHPSPLTIKPKYVVFVDLSLSPSLFTVKYTRLIHLLFYVFFCLLPLL